MNAYLRALVRFAICLGVVAVAASSARADEEEKGEPSRHDAVWARHRSLNLVVGGPLGILGAEFEYAPIPQIGLSAGLGLDEDGVQAAAMLRVRGILGAWALGVGGGLSVGPQEVRNPHSPDFFGDGPTFWSIWGWRLYGNLEVAAEARSIGGVYTRISFGVSFPTGTQSSRRCGNDAGFPADYPLSCPDRDLFPYASVAVGYSF
ncbi:MAG: hypothetical protein IPK60_12405 [Sandaracinaceae bacterium]|nr:hypothetical protein [Sandaracinaceae bacterium]